MIMPLITCYKDRWPLESGFFYMFLSTPPIYPWNTSTVIRLMTVSYIHFINTRLCSKWIVVVSRAFTMILCEKHWWSNATTKIGYRKNADNQLFNKLKSYQSDIHLRL